MHSTEKQHYFNKNILCSNKQSSFSDLVYFDKHRILNLIQSDKTKLRLLLPKEFDEIFFPNKSKKLIFCIYYLWLKTKINPLHFTILDL